MITIAILFFVLTVYLYIKATMFYGELKFLYKNNNIRMKDITVYRLCRVTFFISLIIFIAAQVI